MCLPLEEKSVLYIGTTYGDDACQERLLEKQLVLLEPTYPDAVLARHTICAQTVTARVTKMVTSLQKQLDVIEAELLLTPADLNLLKSQMEVDNKLELAKFELIDVVEVKTTADESIAFTTMHGRPTVRERIAWLGAEGTKYTPWCLVSVPQSLSTRLSRMQIGKLSVICTIH